MTTVTRHDWLQLDSHTRTSREWASLFPVLEGERSKCKAQKLKKESASVRCPYSLCLGKEPVWGFKVTCILVTGWSWQVKETAYHLA